MAIKIKSSKVGSLHEHLGVPKKDSIPVSKLKIKSSDSKAIRKKKQFALNARKWNHEYGGKAEYGADLNTQNNNLNYNWNLYPNGYNNNPYSNQQQFNPYDIQQNQQVELPRQQLDSLDNNISESFNNQQMNSVYDFFKEHPEYTSNNQPDVYNQSKIDRQYLEPIDTLPAKKLETETPDMNGLLSNLSMKGRPSSNNLQKGNISSMIGDVGLGLADVAGSLAKSDSPFGAAMRGGSQSVKTIDSITKPFEAIPGAKMVTAPLKAASFLFGSIMSAISQRIKNQEFKKAKDYRLYLDRNMTPLSMNRGQSGEYGLKIKSNLIDEIHSDFDKYLNLK